MKSIDFLVIFANKDSYYLRHSGTIIEAYANVVIPIVPNYPIFRTQITNITLSGLVYNDTDNLLAAVSKAITEYENYFKRVKLHIMTRNIIQNINIKF